MDLAPRDGCARNVLILIPEFTLACAGRDLIWAMQAIVTSIIAVLGTLSGAALNHAFVQHSRARRRASPRHSFRCWAGLGWAGLGWHGMSVADFPWTPPDGGPTREVPVCANDLHKMERGIEPEMRRVQQTGSPSPVYYVNSGFAPAYWGGFGFGPGMLTGFLLGEVLSGPGFGWGGPGGGGGDYGGGDFGGGGDGENWPYSRATCVHCGTGYRA